MRFVHDPWHMFARQMSVWRRGGSHHSISVPLQCVLFPPRAAWLDPLPHTALQAAPSISAQPVLEKAKQTRGLFSAALPQGLLPQRGNLAGEGGERDWGSKGKLPGTQLCYNLCQADKLRALCLCGGGAAAAYVAHTAHPLRLQRSFPQR